MGDLDLVIVMLLLLFTWGVVLHLVCVLAFTLWFYWMALHVLIILVCFVRNEVGMLIGWFLLLVGVLAMTVVLFWAYS